MALLNGSPRLSPKGSLSPTRSPKGSPKDQSASLSPKDHPSPRLSPKKLVGATTQGQHAAVSSDDIDIVQPTSTAVEWSPRAADSAKVATAAVLLSLLLIRYRQI